MDISVERNPNWLKFTVNGRLVYTFDASDFQDGSAISAEDVCMGQQSVAVRLGRKSDMFMIAGFNENGIQTCTRALSVRLRDGEDIGITYRGGGAGGRDLYGIEYGRNHDLKNVYCYRFADDAFLFDEMAPRTGWDRIVDDVITRGKYGLHDVIEGGCV